MRDRAHTLFLCAALVAGCGGAVHHADEPTLASQAQPLSEDTPHTGDLASACDRTVWSFHPTTAGNYRFEAQSDVPMSLRLFSMSPDLYLDTGRTDGGTARLEAVLHTDTTYAITMASTDCRTAHFAMSVERAYVSVTE